MLSHCSALLPAFSHIHWAEQQENREGDVRNQRELQELQGARLIKWNNMKKGAMRGMTMREIWKYRMWGNSVLYIEIEPLHPGSLKYVWLSETNNQAFEVWLRTGYWVCRDSHYRSRGMTSWCPPVGWSFDPGYCESKKNNILLKRYIEIEHILHMNYKVHQSREARED